MGVQVRPLFPVLFQTTTKKEIAMDELKEKLSALGIDEDKVDGVIEAVVGFIKDKVPDGMEGILDSVMKGEMPDVGGDMLDKVKGLFGG